MLAKEGAHAYVQVQAAEDRTGPHPEEPSKVNRLVLTLLIPGEMKNNSNNLKLFISFLGTSY